MYQVLMAKGDTTSSQHLRQTYGWAESQRTQRTVRMHRVSGDSGSV